MPCQLTNIPEISKENHWLNNLLQIRVSILRSFKRNIKYLINWLLRLLKRKRKKVIAQNNKSLEIRKGDTVKVKTKDEIQSMLNDWGKHRGCLFIDEMYEHCGKTFKVLKEINHFFDEAKQQFCKCKEIVLLQDVVCSGRQRLYINSCDRQCFFFWHKDWLEENVSKNI